MTFCHFVRNKFFNEKYLGADDFFLSLITQGAIPSSFALGYQYFAHTGLNNIGFNRHTYYSFMGSIFQ